MPGRVIKPGAPSFKGARAMAARAIAARAVAARATAGGNS